MNNQCPTCGATYNVSDQHVGRSFVCTRCESNLVIQAGGLALAGGQQVTAQPSMPGGAAGGTAAFDAGGGFPDTPGGTKSGSGGFFMEALLFRKFVGPVILQVIFWLGILVIIGYALFGMYTGVRFMSVSALGGMLMIVGSVIGLALASLFWRLYCECAILTFRILVALLELINLKIQK